MSTEMTRGFVTIPRDIEAALRTQVTEDYGPRIPDISEVPIAQLMRFVVLIAAGIPEEKAKRGLYKLSRGRTKNMGEFTDGCHAGT